MPPQHAEQGTVPVIRFDVAGIQFNSPLEIRFRSRPIPLEIPFW